MAAVTQSLSLRREPLSIIDAAWLRMDRPTNLMMICGMMSFAGRLDLNAVKDIIRHRLLCFHRFRQRVVRGPRPWWEEDPYFDLDWHVRRIALPQGERLEALVSDLISTPLDPDKPMWQYHLVDIGADESALVLRIHHCYGDGFALMHVVTAMTDAAPNHAAAAGMDVGLDIDRRSAWERLFGPVSETLGDAIRAADVLVEGGLELIRHPASAVRYGMTGVGLAEQAAVIATMAPDSPTRFKGPLGVMKRVAWAPPLPLSEVKALAKAYDCSVNDVLMNCVTGALRAYLLRQGDAVEGIEVRALVPVNLRAAGPVTDLGNHFGLVFLSMPVGMADPYARLLEVKRRMGALKHSQQPQVALGILASMGVLPEAMKERVLETLAANASAVVTNVRGLDEPRYFAGKRIERQVFWVPQSGGIGMGVSVLSNAGRVDFGVVTDVQRVADPEAIIDDFCSEFEAMLFGALLARWPEEAERGGAARDRAHGKARGKSNDRARGKGRRGAA